VCDDDPTLKVSVGLSLVGVVVGEFQSTSLGLGFLIRRIFRMTVVMTSIAILAIVSLLLYIAIVQLDSTVKRRRGASDPARTPGPRSIEVGIDQSRSIMA
jgi:ABC-type nitrate/sulfonate/bicarbonate transport system permease component